MHEAPLTFAGSSGASHDGTASNLPEVAKKCKLPTSIISAIEDEAAGLEFGRVTLELHYRDGQLARYVVSRERSAIVGGTL
jgi:hypothetical protein